MTKPQDSLQHITRRKTYQHKNHDNILNKLTEQKTEYQPQPTFPVEGALDD